MVRVPMIGVLGNHDVDARFPAVPGSAVRATCTARVWIADTAWELAAAGMRSRWPAIER